MGWAGNFLLALQLQPPHPVSKQLILGHSHSYSGSVTGRGQFFLQSMLPFPMESKRPSFKVATCAHQLEGSNEQPPLPPPGKRSVQWPRVVELDVPVSNWRDQKLQSRLVTWGLVLEATWARGSFLVMEFYSSTTTGFQEHSYVNTKCKKVEEIRSENIFKVWTGEEDFFQSAAPHQLSFCTGVGISTYCWDHLQLSQNAWNAIFVGVNTGAPLMHYGGFSTVKQT